MEATCPSTNRLNKCVKSDTVESDTTLQSNPIIKNNRSFVPKSNLHYSYPQKAKKLIFIFYKFINLQKKKFFILFYFILSLF